MNAHFEIHKEFSVFAFFQSCKSNLPVPESGYHKAEGNIVNSESIRRCVDLGAVTIYIHATHGSSEVEYRMVKRNVKFENSAEP